VLAYTGGLAPTGLTPATAPMRSSSASACISRRLAPLSFRGASYSGVFTLLPLLTGLGRSHHGEILRQAAALAEAGALRPLLHDRSSSLTDVAASAEFALEAAPEPQSRVVR
jgi:hypothetical protein